MKGKNTPYRIVLQGDNEDVLTSSKVKIIKDILSIASLSHSRENVGISVKLSYFDNSDFSSLSNTFTKFSNDNILGFGRGNDVSFLMNSLKIDVMERVDSHLYLGIYNYDTSGLFYEKDKNLKKQYITSQRYKGDYHALQIEQESGKLLKEYIIQRNMDAKWVMARKNNKQYIVRGNYEYWNHGVFSTFVNGKFNFILNAEKVELRDNIFAYYNF